MVVNRSTRRLLPILLVSVLTACTALPPSPKVSDEEMTRLRQEQQDMAQELQKLREELARLRGEAVPPMPATPQEAPTVTATASTAYRDAFLAFAAGHYQDAVFGFESYLRQHADSTFRTGARYWLGHSYAGMAAPEKAIAAFEQLVSEAPDSSRAPASLVHIASLYQQLNRPDQVREALQRLRTRYPDSAETRRIETEGLNAAKDTR